MEANLAADYLVLIVVCLLGGIASTSIGTSGGFTFAAMASIFPVSVVVPIHAMVEVSASCFRGLLLWNNIKWAFVISFLVGGAAGAVFAMPFVGALPDDILQLLLGVFIVSVTWLPLSQVVAQSANYAPFSGAATFFLTVFVGATGPLVAALLSKRFSSHPQVIATHAACMTAQHAAKIAIFALAGWSMTAFAGEILAMIISTTVGTWLGRYIIVTGPQHLIKLAFKIAVSLLGIHLAFDAIAKMLAA